MKPAESSRFMSSFLGGLSWVARARQRSVSLPVPHSRMTLMIFCLIPGVNGTFMFPARIWVHLSITPSGAPCGKAKEEPIQPADSFYLFVRESPLSCFMKGTCLHKHLGHGRPAGFVWSAVNRHGFPIPGEFEGEFLPHQLLNHLHGEEAEPGGWNRRA